ncbi:hypothetical protein BYT27DRAFT_7224692 [Phlegmacium glaucopus]|nr:hypothetical protein BYT27DRAFT_7224692 [Phlegmacium glaucopus]
MSDEGDNVEQMICRPGTRFRAASKIAHLSREAWPIDQQKCSHCTLNNWALWRCTDCMLAHPVCWSCMRHTHRGSPLHCIEHWTGTHFCQAALWEVGTYILVWHHAGIGLCNNLTANYADDVPQADALNNVHVGSFVQIQTLFLAQVLDYFWLCNLELKASAYQCNQLIRRLTMLMAPSKWAGYGHTGQDPKNPPQAKNSNFCPACPQPGINLAENWKDDVNRQNPEGNVWLCNGSGMMPNCQEYFNFLKWAQENSTKAPCESTFRAITNALRGSKACDITGIVSIACTRHGYYALDALVDLFKGEQQKNVDFAFLQVLKTTSVSPEQGVMLIYDIACQYSVHLHKQIGHKLPFGLSVDHAIGLFHVHCHKDECLGIVIGEILESPWSNLNSISPTVQTVTLPHRAEMLDNHASDSNHKKALGITDPLVARYWQASAMADETQTYYLEMTSIVEAERVNTWEDEILKAELMREADWIVMDIYHAGVPDQLLDDTSSASGSGLAMPISPVHQWIQFALMVEEKQIDVQDHVRQLTHGPSDANGQSIEQEQEKLVQLLIKLKELQEAARIPECFACIAMQQESEVEFDIDMEAKIDPSASASASAAPMIVDPSEDAPIPVERKIIFLPSNGNVDGIFKAIELPFRINQAKTYLNQIWDLISEKLKSVRTQAQKAIYSLNCKIALHSQIYSRCQAQLITLGCDKETLNIFCILTKEDVEGSTLSWLWGTGGLASTFAAKVHPNADHVTVLEFRQVHWLRAHAQKNRWEEELILVTYEMQWTVCYFVQAHEWTSGLPNVDVSASAKVYAARQETIWQRLALAADWAFWQVNSQYISPLIRIM